MLIYAGIGSRKTPHDMLQVISHLAEQLAERGWLLRSGHADGADMAFEGGATLACGAREIYLPWPGFNGGGGSDRSHIVPHITEDHWEIARQFHPQWSACGRGARYLHARNVNQVLGLNLQTPADMVVCWTEGARGLGGTGQALRIARAYGIPIFDLADINQQTALVQFVQECEQ